MAKHVMIITDSTVKMAVGTTEPTWASTDAFSCQVTEASIGVEAQNTTAPGNYCGDGPSDHVLPSKWTVTLAGLQDWNADTDSVSQFLFDNDAAAGWIQIVIPDVTGTGSDIATAEAPVTFRAGQFSGPASEPLLFSTTLPCSAKPTIVKSTVA